MFIFRLCSSTVLVAVFLISIFWKCDGGFILLSVFGVLLTYLAVNEFLAMLKKIDKESYPVLSGIAGSMYMATLFIAHYYGTGWRQYLSEKYLSSAIFILIMIVPWLMLLFAKNNDKILMRVLMSVAPLLIVVFPLSYISRIYSIGEGSTFSGRYLLLFMIVVTKAGDTGAYCVGSLSNIITNGGNHKIVPNISPKKSWEGTVGGLLTSVGAALALWKTCLHEYSLTYIIILGIVLFTGGFFGDLVESCLKRMTGVKDSGSLVPGLGGVLDFLDSLLINSPLFFYIITF